MQLDLFEVEASKSVTLSGCRNMIASCAAMHNPHIMPILSNLEYALHTPLSRIRGSYLSYVANIRENIGCVMSVYYDDSVVLREGWQVVSYTMCFESLMNSLILLTECKDGWLFPPLGSTFRQNMLDSFRNRVISRLRVHPGNTI